MSAVSKNGFRAVFVSFLYMGLRVAAFASNRYVQPHSPLAVYPKLLIIHCLILLISYFTLQNYAEYLRKTNKVKKTTFTRLSGRWVEINKLILFCVKKWRIVCVFRQKYVILQSN